ncbi:uncharacterized protein LOC143242835 [Tachypleus tridentatus]|uniref:uncharacterized protein LOC143242835 n=1 Tax=Tachypleus tridentatus TaxID=6853 RepID=UPI003FD26E00
MMWNMAHLWLKAEVNDLESKVKGGGFPQLSPYLVPDISSFCQHLALSKQLRLSKRFVIVVPSVDYCQAIFSEDGLLYEACVMSINEQEGTCVVHFLGYGNEEEVWIGDLLASQGKHARAQQELAAQGYFADNIDVEAEEKLDFSVIPIVLKSVEGCESLQVQVMFVMELLVFDLLQFTPGSKEKLWNILYKQLELGGIDLKLILDRYGLYQLTTEKLGVAIVDTFTYLMSYLKSRNFSVPKKLIESLSEVLLNHCGKMVNSQCVKTALLYIQREELKQLSAHNPTIQEKPVQHQASTSRLSTKRKRASDDIKGEEPLK